MKIKRFCIIASSVWLVFLIAITAVPSCAQEAKPSILVIWGDDIGQSNISAYTRGLVGYKTPNIDRIAKEGILFTDYYGEQSCTAARYPGSSGCRLPGPRSESRPAGRI